MQENNEQTQSEQKQEYVCKLKTKKHSVDYTTYKYYNKDRSFRLLKFMHRAVSNVFLRAYLKCFSNEGARLLCLTIFTRSIFR